MENIYISDFNVAAMHTLYKALIIITKQILLLNTD
jgi:hypothetical protein